MIIFNNIIVPGLLFIGFILSLLMLIPILLQMITEILIETKQSIEQFKKEFNLNKKED